MLRGLRHIAPADGKRNKGIETQAASCMQACRRKAVHSPQPWWLTAPTDSSLATTATNPLAHAMCKAAAVATHTHTHTRAHTRAGTRTQTQTHRHTQTHAHQLVRRQQTKLIDVLVAQTCPPSRVLAVHRHILRQGQFHILHVPVSGSQYEQITGALLHCSFKTHPVKHSLCLIHRALRNRKLVRVPDLLILLRVCQTPNWFALRSALCGGSACSQCSGC